MNDEMKGKSGKVKVMYVRSDDDSDKRTHNPRTGKGGGRPGKSRADIHHFDLAAFTFHFIVHAFLHQRCAKRADYPKSARFAMISYQSLRLSYLLNKTDCCLEQCPR